MARVSLSDLYVRGKELKLDVGDDYEVVWLQKLNPIEHGEAIKKADAARARVLACKYDRDGDEYQSILNDILSLQREVLVEVLVAVEESRITPVKDAKCAAEDEWKENNYLQGLRDAWFDELSVKFQTDPEDKEAARVKEELERFLSQVREEVDEDVKAFRQMHESMSDQELINASMEHRIKVAGDMAWVNEYYRAEVFFGVRKDNDHTVKYFPNRAAVDALQHEVISQLREAFRTLVVEPSEGKDSAGLPPSSDSSGQSDKEGTAPSSGQTAAAA